MAHSVTSCCLSATEINKRSVDILDLLGHKNRLLIVSCLADGKESCVGQLVRKTGISRLCLSQHLAKLRERDMVSARRQGRRIFYSLNCPEVSPLLDVLQRWYGFLPDPHAASSGASARLDS
ncbi:ArsR/SmtB family transcription factor [Varunaivibrio sulfuroxidans]|uniref:ArsR family transcriptional regulator n=1 Tax=Varunaivibrio sulfuroxidans TaxID=1773489 RepID=A0A4R3J9J1_9PROT|nr:metalloregulator ArsR/SmtB family transcription factor [Varunaivibrio sulfuroxidans]TCS61666.1 ArsR family transcriptional regulator [Varunaivibrio sulfuroxidans]WES32148.1 metalloregulator ArsR/SmtB family transcription factor [Varunaivibrio sulfuroxidans]